MWFVVSWALAGPGPTEVVQTLFDVAESGEVAKLEGLCDPQLEGDGDTRRLCELADRPEGVKDFQEAFRGGKVTGEPIMEGDRAVVPFVFGPGYQGRAEKMSLVRRGDAWYLLSF